MQQKRRRFVFKSAARCAACLAWDIHTLKNWSNTSLGWNCGVSFQRHSHSLRTSFHEGGTCFAFVGKIFEDDLKEVSRSTKKHTLVEQWETLQVCDYCCATVAVLCLHARMRVKSLCEVTGGVVDDGPCFRWRAARHTLVCSLPVLPGLPSSHRELVQVLHQNVC